MVYPCPDCQDQEDCFFNYCKKSRELNTKTMALSKQTTDQIRKEAGTYCHPIDGIIPNQHDGYTMGATAWAVWKEKAEGYEKALKEIQNYSSHGSSAHIIATKTLEQLK